MTEVEAYKMHIRKGKGYCSYCGQKLQKYPKQDNPLRPTVDHQIPVSRGGKDDIENTVGACMRCNFMKGSMTVAEFLNHVRLIKNFLENGE